MDTLIKWADLLIPIILLLITGYIAIIRRIDSNKKDQEIRDTKIQASVDQLQQYIELTMNQVNKRLADLEEKINGNL